ncbi:class I SAM-dependent DNA methyltransferase [Anianabacter salinae]|uniref:class I SAM-dependent DNA methyltransferase n=1 Tax=Anianabacter salinae TaxID=2851023 RepID=UPI00225E29DC|nr:class I SAM-dependent methyltransferase [Anianabacter salinae]MBV0913278.1 class I SAM-dependent methyltransferase [Anianabacter salinae]
MTADTETLAAYDREAARYAEMIGDSAARDDTLAAFAKALTPGARVLDVGCGPGHAAAFLAAQGFAVDAIDASRGMAQIAREAYGIEVTRSDYSMMTDEAVYDGIWAAFSLHHAPRVEMAGNLKRLFRALKPGGLLAVTLKTGEGERRDRLGRYTTFYAEDEIGLMLRTAGFKVGDVVTGTGSGLSGEESEWLMVFAHA